MLIQQTRTVHHPPRLLAALALCSLAILISSAPGKAQTVPPAQTLSNSFQSAAAHWQVPVQVLMAVGYVESHWDQRAGAPSLDNGYGIMHLVDGPDGTLQRASALTNLPIDAIRKDPSANIEAGAAILSDISHKLPNPLTNNTNLADWHDVIALYSGSTDRSVMEGYAQEVYKAVKEGRTLQLPSGETMTLPPTSVADLPQPQTIAPNSDDYPSALWVPANQNNYSVGRSYGPLNFIVIHDTEGSYSSAISWFQNPSSGVSAHYVVRSSDGQITQMVREANTAYHAGNWDYNVRSIGIEHEGFMSQQGWYTEPMYQASSALARTVADKYNIKKDRAHIIGHYQIPGTTHQDPGPNWDWTHYMSLLHRDSLKVALVDNTDATFEAIPAQIDPQHYWWTYGAGYDNSSTYSTLSVADPQYSTNSGTWTGYIPTTGYYDIYAFIPWVDNHTPDTANALYKVYSADGMITAPVSQQAVTNVGDGSWAHIGRFRFNGGEPASVSLADYTGEDGRNVWFDSLMWIPSLSTMPLPTSTNTPYATSTRPPAPTSTRTLSATNTPRVSPRTPTPIPTATDTPIPLATWTPGPCGMRFSDLEDTHWAYDYIASLYCRSIIGGYADGTIHPNSGSTRGQFAKMLALSFGWPLLNPARPTFLDVPPDNGFYRYIESAYSHGVIGGYPDGTFKPNNPVTRSQIAKMLVLTRAWPLVQPPTPTFSDLPSDHWAYRYVETAFRYGVLTGYADNTFRPNLDVTRAQLAKMLTLALQN